MKQNSKPAGAPATSVDPRLAMRAARLWPESPALQREWLRAISVVRSTQRGWLLERIVERAAA